METVEAPNVAVIDVGSNSIKVLVATRLKGNLTPLFAATRETRIGAGISQSNPHLSEESMHAAVESIKDLLSAIELFHIQTMQIVATSAVRDAQNKERFRQLVQEHTGYELQILSGEEEALGIAAGVSTDPGLDHLPDFSAFDLGGGSMECIRIQTASSGEKTIERAISLPLGAVRLTELYVEDSSLPLTTHSIEAIQKKVREALAESNFAQPTSAVVGTSGAFTISRSILAHRLSCLPYQLPSMLELSFLRALFRELSQMTLAERQEIPKLPPSRADIFPVALLTVITTAELIGAERIYHSSRNLRFGLASRLLAPNSSVGGIFTGG